MTVDRKCNSFAAPFSCKDIPQGLLLSADKDVFEQPTRYTDMKKRFVLLLLTVVSAISAFAQGKPNAGDIIYGTVTDSIGPVAGIIIIEKNSNNRIMAQTTTDENGNFSFRLVNPDNEISVLLEKPALYCRHNSITLPITDQQFDIKLDKVSDADLALQGVDAGLDIVFGPDPKPIDYYIPFRDFIHYYSIEDLCNNMLLYF